MHKTFLKPNLRLSNVHNPPVFKGKFLLGTKAILVLSAAVGIITILLVSSILGIGLTQVNFKGYNYTCNSDANCINGFMCQNGLCSCPTSKYYDTQLNLCTSRLSIYTECKRDEQCSEGMQCTYYNGFYNCICASNRFWNGSSCISKLSFNDGCSNSNYPSDACDPSIGLKCNGSTCQCNTTSYWDSSKCSKLEIYGSNCTSSNGCYSSLGLSCTSQGSCDCSSTNYWNGSTCISRNSINGVCSSSYNCLETLGLSCQTNQCLCSSTAYWTGSTCAASGTYGSWCSASVICNPSLRLTCQSSSCLCQSNTYWNGVNCTNQLSIGSQCSANNNCLQSLGLVCTSSFCTCGTNLYWSVSSCVAQLTYGSSCTSTTQCRTTSSLTCLSGICSCYKSQYVSGGICYALPSQWVWSSTLNLYYAPVHSYVNWASAKSWCQSYGGELFTVTTTAEYNFLGTMYSTLAYPYWVNGYSYSGFNFRWLPSGSFIPYTYGTGYWCPSQPDNGFPVENCLQVGWCGNILFNDMACNYNGKFLCEKR